MQLDFLASKSPLGPSKSMICPRNTLKCPQNLQNLCTLAVVSFKPRTGHILGYVAQNAILRAPSPRATTHFLWFPPPPPPLELPKRTPRSLYLGPRGYGKLQEEARKVGAKKGPQGPTRNKKLTFFKNDPRPFGMPRQVFLAHF